jgi:hypothetical protein
VRISRPLLLAAALQAAIGCSVGDSGRGSVQVISREAFIEAYVELRVASHGYRDQVVPLAVRDQILQDLGLTPEDLLTFVEVHGENVGFMFEIWEEVDARFRELRTGSMQQPSEDSARTPGGNPDRPQGG